MSSPARSCAQIQRINSLKSRSLPSQQPGFPQHRCDITWTARSPAPRVRFSGAASAGACPTWRAIRARVRAPFRRPPPGPPRKRKSVAARADHLVSHHRGAAGRDGSFARRSSATKSCGNPVAIEASLALRSAAPSARLGDAAREEVGLSRAFCAPDGRSPVPCLAPWRRPLSRGPAFHLATRGQAQHRGRIAGTRRDSVENPTDNRQGRSLCYP